MLFKNLDADSLKQLDAIKQLDADIIKNIEIDSAIKNVDMDTLKNIDADVLKNTDAGDLVKGLDSADAAKVADIAKKLEPASLAKAGGVDEVASSLKSVEAKGLKQRAADLVKKVGSNAFDFVKKNPKLTLAGITVATIALYAVINGISFGEAAGQLTSKTMEELKPLASALGEAAGEVAKIGAETTGAVVSAFFKSLGISMETVAMVGGIILGLIILYIIIKFIPSSSRYEYYGGGNKNGLKSLALLTREINMLK